MPAYTVRKSILYFRPRSSGSVRDGCSPMRPGLIMGPKRNMGAVVRALAGVLADAPAELGEGHREDAPSFSVLQATSPHCDGSSPALPASPLRPRPALPRPSTVNASLHSGHT